MNAETDHAHLQNVFKTKWEKKKKQLKLIMGCDQHFAAHIKKSVSVFDRRTWVPMLSQMTLSNDEKKRVKSLDVGEKWMRLWVKLFQKWSVWSSRKTCKQIGKHVDNFTYFFMILWNSIMHLHESNGIDRDKKRTTKKERIHHVVQIGSRKQYGYCVTTVSMGIEHEYKRHVSWDQ